MRVTSQKHFKALIALGIWTLIKFMGQSSNAGVYQAARNMRKQGYPVELALFVLTRRV